MATHIITFTKVKDTKNTVRFQEDEREGEPQVVGALYVQKWAVRAATKLTVTIEEQD